jgi:hypothetical protein
LVALFELVGLSEGLIRDANAHEQAVIQLRARANELMEEVVTTAQQVQTGLPCWGSELISGQDREEQRQKLDELKGFLESLQAFNTPGKLKNFTRTITEIQAQKANLDLVKQVEELNDLVQELTPITGYLATATAVLPPQDPWRDQMESTRGSWRAKLLDPALRGRPDFRQIINRALQKAKDDYKTTYLNLHKKARLGINEDEKKKELLKDPRLDHLKKLAAGISLLPHASLTELQTRLSKLTPCFTLVRDDLDASPICPHCNFRPQEETLGASGLAVLQQIDGQLDTTLENWHKTLVDNLSDPTAKKSIGLLPSAQKAVVEGFLKSKQLPEKIEADLVQGIQTALSGLIAMNVIPADLLDSLSAGGAPCTVEQLRTRFEEFLQRITRGREAAKVRLIIVRGEASEAPP